jgi:hypothetical protein
MSDYDIEIDDELAGSEASLYSDNDDLLEIDAAADSKRTTRKKKLKSGAAVDTPGRPFQMKKPRVEPEVKTSSKAASGRAGTSSKAAAAAAGQDNTETTSNITRQENQPQLLHSARTKVDRICEYALVLMHCILYKINYYDRKTHFDKYIKYNIIVYVGS